MAPKKAVGICRAERYGDTIKVIFWDKKRNMRYEGKFDLDELNLMPDFSQYRDIDD